MATSQPRPKIVIVGGGVAGLEVASTLGRRWRGRADAPSITLVDRESAHVWKPMLHTIAAGTRDISQQQTAYLAQARDAGFAYRPGELWGLDRNAREIELAAQHAPDGRLLVPASRLGYDLLVLSTGSQANDFGTPGVAEHCWNIDSRRQADAFNREVRIRLLQCLTQDAPLHIAIVGGGATGVELAAELVQLVEAVTAYGAPDLAGRINITLIEAGPRLLAGFPEDISSATRTRLEAIGIRVLTETQVKAATPKAFMLANGDELQATRDPAIYALGDCAALTPEGASRALPPTAQVAHQQAKYLIDALPRALEGRPVRDFRYRDMGALVSLADYDAFGSLGQFGLFHGQTFRGRLAQISHVMLYRSHQARIHGFWRGGRLWLVDRLNSRVRAPIRLD